MSATDGTRIAIVGAGAIGGWVAARLALAGEARDGAEQQAGRSTPIELDRSGRDFTTADFTRLDRARRRAGHRGQGARARRGRRSGAAADRPGNADRADAQRRALVVRRGRAAAIGRSRRQHRRGASRSSRSSAASSTPSCSRTAPNRDRRQTCRQADPRRAAAAETSERVGAPVRLVRTAPGFGPT